MGKLDQLLSEIQEEIRDKKAELQATQTQLNALHSAHEDLSAQVALTHRKLAEARESLAGSEGELEKKRVEADKVAANILNAAHRARESAERIVKEAEANVAAVINEAQKKAANLTSAIEVKKLELREVARKVDAARGELAQLKKNAVDWGQG